MAGNIFWKETAVTSFSNGSTASITNLSVASTDAQFDNSSTGPLAQMLTAVFELQAKWTGATTGISGGNNVADLYLLPAIDRTNFPDVGTAATASTTPISPNHYVGSFVAAKAPAVSTNVRMETGTIELLPLVYQPYLINQSGQTISSSWILRALPIEGQYT